jgi:hypothetical protein
LKAGCPFFTNAKGKTQNAELKDEEERETLLSVADFRLWIVE